MHRFILSFFLFCKYIYVSDIYPRNYLSHDHPLHWNDEQIVVYDIFERYSGYSYFGIIDFDEYLIPSRNRTMKQMIVSKFHICLL